MDKRRSAPCKNCSHPWPLKTLHKFEKCVCGRHKCPNCSFEERCLDCHNILNAHKEISIYYEEKQVVL